MRKRRAVWILLIVAALLLGAGTLVSPVIFLNILRFLPVGGGGRTFEAQTDGSTATLAAPKDVSRQVKGMRVTAVPKSAWPESAIGGLYELAPDGAKFDVPVPFIVTFATPPPSGVALGYWRGESQGWEYLPTIHRAPAVLETRLLHASQVGGYVPLIERLADAGPPNYEDPRARELDKGIRESLKRLALAQGLGEEEAEREEAERLHQLLSELADLVIAACLKNPTSEHQHAFFYVWALADSDVFGFPDIASRFEATERQCRPREEPPPITAYVIDQTDTFPVSLSVPGPGIAAKLTGTQTIVSKGSMVPGAPVQGHPWQTQWEVLQDAESEAAGASQLSLPEVTSTEISGQSTSTDQTRLLFSLVGVKEGESFPIRSVRRGPYEESGTGPVQDFTILHKGRPVYTTVPVDPNYRETVEGGAITITGILQKDLGAQGADIAFGDLALPGGGTVENLPPEFAALQQSVTTQLSTLSRNTPPLRIRRTGEPSPSPTPGL